MGDILFVLRSKTNREIFIFVKPGITRSFALLMSLILASSGLAQTSGSSARNEASRGKETATKTVPSKIVTADGIHKEIKEALSVIEGNYAGAKTMNYGEVFKSSIDSMLHTLD